MIRKEINKLCNKAIIPSLSFTESYADKSLVDRLPFQVQVHVNIFFSITVNKQVIVLMNFKLLDVNCQEGKKFPHVNSFLYLRTKNALGCFFAARLSRTYGPGRHISTCFSAVTSCGVLVLSEGTRQAEWVAHWQNTAQM